LLCQVCVQPSGLSDAKGEDVVNPCFRVIILIFLAVCGLVPREAVRSLVLVSWDVDKFKIEQEYGGDPSVDGHVGLYIGVVQHPTDKLGIHLDDEVLDTN
jgi:hypothetical protein